MSNQFVKSLGSFEVTSNKLVASDPCYKLDEEHSWLQATLDAVNGSWRAEVVVTDEGPGWLGGQRVAELRVVSEANNGTFVWEREGSVLGVDSGQMSFVDLPKYEGDTRVFSKVGTLMESGGEWYSMVCELTNKSDYSVYPPVFDNTGDIFDGGAASSTGFGDGAYRLFVHRDEESGLVTAARVIFIEHNDSPPDAFDEEEYLDDDDEDLDDYVPSEGSESEDC